MNILLKFDFTYIIDQGWNAFYLGPWRISATDWVRLFTCQFIFTSLHHVLLETSWWRRRLPRLNYLSSCLTPSSSFGVTVCDNDLLSLKFNVKLVDVFLLDIAEIAFVLGFSKTQFHMLDMITRNFVCHSALPVIVRWCISDLFFHEGCIHRLWRPIPFLGFALRQVYLVVIGLSIVC
jgi:hypothetical protein